MVPSDGLMSFVVRHRCANSRCRAVGMSEKGSVEMTIGRPVAFAASAKETKRASPRPYWPQLSYLISFF